MFSFCTLHQILVGYKIKDVGRACRTHESAVKGIQNFGCKAEGKRLLERPRYRWEDNIKMDLRVTGWEVWTGLIWHIDRDWWQALVNIIMNLRVLWKQEIS
jgi:hypothetical protein